MSFGFDPSHQVGGSVDVSFKRDSDGKMKVDSVGVSAKIYEDAREILKAPAEVLHKGIDRDIERKEVREATRREREHRNTTLMDSETAIVKHPIHRKSPPREEPSAWSAWFGGKAFRESLSTEESAAKARLSSAETYTATIEYHRAKALEEQLLAAKRLAAAQKAKDQFETSKIGWFGWR